MFANPFVRKPFWGAAAVVALIAAAFQPAAWAQGTAWPHWTSGQVITGEGYSLRVLRVDTSGDGWEEVEAAGTNFQSFRPEDGAPTGQFATVQPVRLLLLRGAGGVTSAFAAGRIPVWARDALLAEEQVRQADCKRGTPTAAPDCPGAFAVSVLSLQRIAAQLLQSETQMDALSQAALFGCSDYDKEFAITTPAKSVGDSGSKTLREQGFDGTITGGFTLGLKAKRQSVVFRVKTAFCIPWMAYLKSVNLEIDAFASATVTVDGKFDVATTPKTLRKEVKAFPIATIRASFGPIPVVIPIDVPITVGLEYQAAAAGTLATRAEASGTFYGRIRCTPACSFEAPSSGLDFTVKSASKLDGPRAQVYAFVDAGVRAALYDRDAAQFTAGVRSGLEADAFYRAPALGCGNADGAKIEAPGIDNEDNGNKSDEIVEGRLVDLDGRIDVFAEASAWKLGSVRWAMKLLDKHLTLVDLGLQPGSTSVATPMFLANTDWFNPPGPLSFQAKMRPCWPWSDPIEEATFAIDDAPPRQVTVSGASSSAAAPPAALAVSIARSGLCSNSLTLGRDRHGRDLRAYTTYRSAQGNVTPMGFFDAANRANGSKQVPLGAKIYAHGWAFDPDGNPAAPVRGVRLLDGLRLRVLAEAGPESGLGIERPDVVGAYSRHDALFSGWARNFTLYNSPFGRLTVIATARDGEQGENVLNNNQILEVVPNDTIQTAGEIDETDDGMSYLGNTKPQGATVPLPGYKDDYRASCGGGARSEDAVYRLTLSGRRSLVLSTAGSAFNTVLYVVRVAFPTMQEVACNDDAHGTRQSELRLDLAAGTYYVVVDGFGTSNRGSFALTARFNTTNVALGKPADQSSTYQLPCSAAAKAVDGNTNGNYFGCSVTHTHADNGAFWKVDLGRTYDVARVVLYNRTDCCSDRLGFFDLDVSTDGVTWSSLYVGRAAGPIETFPLQRPARYVRVRLRGTSVLSLAEVQVFAY